MQTLGKAALDLPGPLAVRSLRSGIAPPEPLRMEQLQRAPIVTTSRTRGAASGPHDEGSQERCCAETPDARVSLAHGLVLGLRYAVKGRGAGPRRAGEGGGDRLFLREGLGRPPQADETRTPRLHDSPGAIDQMSWAEMQLVFASHFAAEVGELHRVGASRRRTGASWRSGATGRVGGCW